MFLKFGKTVQTVDQFHVLLLNALRLPSTCCTMSGSPVALVVTPVVLLFLDVNRQIQVQRSIYF